MRKCKKEDRKTALGYHANDTGKAVFRVFYLNKPNRPFFLDFVDFLNV